MRLSIKRKNNSLSAIIPKTKVFEANVRDNGNLFETKMGVPAWKIGKWTKVLSSCGSSHTITVYFISTRVESKMLALNPPTPSANSFASLDPWTQSLVGVIQLSAEDPTDTYVDYLEEKYS